MKYALVKVLPEVPPGGVCAGIDWASADHAVCVVDMAGRVRDLRVPKTCATWAKVLQSAVERSVCAGAVLARREVG